MEVDVLIVGDFRFQGGTSTAISSEVRALAAAGYRVGLMAFGTVLLGNWRAIHPQILALRENPLVDFVPQDQTISARLCCLHHPSVFETLPAIPPRVDCSNTLLIVHHPPLDSFGETQYDVGRVMAITTELFGDVVWAPVGPVVRDAFARVSPKPPLTAADWFNTIDVTLTPKRRLKVPGEAPVIGRHCRPEAVKWPDDRAGFLAAFPDDARVTVRLMGYGTEQDEIVEDRPENWETLPFNAIPVSDFLGSLDYFSNFHSEEWVEAFGRSVLEALSCGLVCFLPPEFEPLFGEAAIYCNPEDVLEQTLAFEADPKSYEDQALRATAYVRRKFGPHVAQDRVRALIGPPKAPPAQPKSQRGNILFLTSNGVGMGHITRCMASARRLGPNCKPTIITMSKAFGVVSDQGMNVEYLPYFKSIGLNYNQWTNKLRVELGTMFKFYRPEVVVFDGNVPYNALLQTLRLFPEIWSVWQRRPLWQPNVGAEYIDMARFFDVVLEPGEHADTVDRGLTKPKQHQVLQVPSVRYLDVEEMLDRTTARSVLGLDQGRPAILLQLGSGNNFNTLETIKLIGDLTDPRTVKNPPQVVFARWRITTDAPELPAHFQSLDAFPISKFLNAFDGAVAFAGYNTFHENIAAKLPTLFASNNHPEQDEQWLRAHYADLRGLALSAQTHNPYQMRRQFTRLLDPRVQDQLRVACSRIDATNGADQTAAFLESLMLTRKPSQLRFHTPKMMEG